MVSLIDVETIKLTWNVLNGAVHVIRVRKYYLCLELITAFRLLGLSLVK